MINVQTCIKESFSIIGKEGSTNDGEGFIQRLWNEANSNFMEVAHLARKDSDGKLVGIWGAMSDLTRSFQPWEENFTKRLYLAGVEVMDDAATPPGWMKWTIPSYEYIYVRNEGQSTFTEAIEYLRENGLWLAGAAHDYTSPENGQGYIYFPIRLI